MTGLAQFHSGPPQAHQPSRARTEAAAFATSAVSYNPKHVAPDPLIRANRQAGSAASDRKTSPIAGASSSAGTSRSFRKSRSAAISPRPSGNTAGAENPPVRARNTAGVETATPGFIKTIPKSGKTGAGESTSPIPLILIGLDARQTGTSAPSAPATSARLIRLGSSFQSRQSSRNAAAASADPPPIPDATGTFFSSKIRPLGVTPASVASVLAARSTRLSASASSPAANGPVTVSDSPASGSALSRSPMPAKIAMLSSRWYPSARRPTTCRYRLILAGANAVSVTAGHPAY